MMNFMVDLTRFKKLGIISVGNIIFFEIQEVKGICLDIFLIIDWAQLSSWCRIKYFESPSATSEFCLGYTSVYMI